MEQAVLSPPDAAVPSATPDELPGETSPVSHLQWVTHPLVKAAAIAGLVVASIAGTWAAWEYLYLGDNLHTVTEGVVYRSRQPDAEMLRQLAKEHKLRSVLNLRGIWTNDDWYQEEVATANELGLDLRHLPLRTHQLAPLQAMRDLVHALDNCPKPLLIHCRQGSDRTSMAVALYRVLHENETPEQAMRSYGLQFGHTGLAYGAHLPHLFELYRDWLTEQGFEHSADRFRKWLMELETLWYFGAEITPESFPVALFVGEPAVLRYRVTNRSEEPWTLAHWPKWGIHLLVRAQLDDISGPQPVKHSTRELRVGGPPGEVAPGESVIFTVMFPAMPAPGRVRLMADLSDKHHLLFGEMVDHDGIGACVRQLECKERKPMQ